MKIQLLSAEVVGQIAAGEVLDRPANMVKELVENSLDAGAREIEVEFNQGGREVTVRDDGVGMEPGDLERALLRHATSKISKTEDLYALHSFGFRGEALASVAAVSQMSLVSRARGSDQGYRLQSEFGSVGAVAQVSARAGTEIRVRELFANVPARLKFLKSEVAEHTHIKTTLKALALAHPHVGWRLRSKDTLLAHWPATEDWKVRAQNVLEVETLFAGTHELEGIRAEVLVGSPEAAIGVNRNMWFFAQERWIQDRSLAAAVMEGYRNLLMQGQFPTVVVRLTLPPDEIDVNVHPTKSQVKFRNSQTVFRVVARAIRGVLESSPWLAGETSNVQSQTELQMAEEPVRQESLRFSGGEFERTQYNTKVFPLAQVREAVNSYSVSAPAEPQSEPAVVEGFRWSDLHVVGQIHQTYIVAQTPEAMYLIDQHAAHERVVFERLMETFKLGKIEIQNLLLPLVLDLPAHEVEALLRFRDSLEKIGVSLERMGPESVAIQAIPTLATDAAVSQAIRHLATELEANSGEAAFERMIGEIFASMACHSVVRAGQTLSAPEMQSLLAQMDQYPLSSFCPHGRPVFVRRRFTEIEREFGRLV